MFQKGGKLEIMHPVWDAAHHFLLTSSEKTQHGPHVRDSIDLKRYMITVVIAVLPALLFGIYNAGYQSAKAYGALADLTDTQLFLNGLVITLPIILTSYVVGGFWEVLFATIRKHSINEGFLVTGILFPLILPPTIPLWQVAVGISFGVVIGKEIFGGTGMNVLNPALTGRVFLFFSYPAEISGDKVWTWLNQTWLPFPVSGSIVDGYTGATALLVPVSAGNGADAVAAMNHVAYHDFSFWNLAYGLVPGSIGETSAIAILIGAIILIITGVASWQIMVSTVVGGIAMGCFLKFNYVAGSDFMPAIMGLPSYYHLVLGGFAFGTAFMTTDPVSASATNLGKYIYGFMIGVLTVLVRVWNPAYPEGMMLAILFMNIFAPLIDYFVIQSSISRRMKRATAE